MDKNERELLYEAYLNQSGIAQMQQRKKQIPGLTPKTDAKNSTALRTSMLPGAGGAGSKFNAAGMSGGVSIDNEEKMVDIKGFGKMKRSDVEKMYDKLMDEAHKAKDTKKFKLLASKLEMMKVLANHL